MGLPFQKTQGTSLLSAFHTQRRGRGRETLDLQLCKERRFTRTPALRWDTLRVVRFHTLYWNFLDWFSSQDNKILHIKQICNAAIASHCSSTLLVAVLLGIDSEGTFSKVALTRGGTGSEK